MTGRQRLRIATVTCCLLALLFTDACQRESPVSESHKIDDGVWFEEVQGIVGLNFVHDAGPPPKNQYFMPQIMGSGTALFDFDGDGRLDIYLLQNAGPDSHSTNKLFHQEKNGHFTDVSAGSGLDVAGYGMGVAIGDVNNDGRLDVFVTEYGRVRLFLNNGGGKFTDITREAGLDSPLWATSASFVDYDRDGWLDLVVVNYVDYDPSRPCGTAGGEPDFCAPKEFLGTVTKLFHNLGGTGGGVRFEDVTLRSGLGRLPGPGLGVVCADFDGDNWPDIFVTNDGQPNRLWINQRGNSFTDEAVSRGVAFNAVGRAEANMGVALGDVLGHGLFDIFVTHLADEMHSLWRQQPQGMFQERTAVAGLATPAWRGTGFGTVLADFDNDGALDLAIVNGAVRRGLPDNTAQPPAYNQYAQRNHLFANDGTGKFRDVSVGNAPFCGVTAVSRGLAFGDIDNNGGVDLLVTSVGAPARLYRNVAKKRGHWLTVRAVDPALKRDAYGARVTVRAGERRWVCWLNPSSSYLCSNDPRAHFGLGMATRVDAIEVLWPDGMNEEFSGCAADQVVTLSRGAGAK